MACRRTRNPLPGPLEDGRGCRAVPVKPDEVTLAASPCHLVRHAAAVGPGALTPRVRSCITGESGGPHRRLSKLLPHPVTVKRARPSGTAQAEDKRGGIGLPGARSGNNHLFRFGSCVGFRARWEKDIAASGRIA